MILSARIANRTPGTESDGLRRMKVQSDSQRKLSQIA